MTFWKYIQRGCALCSILMVMPQAAQAQELLYVGLTDTGWQIFKRSLKTAEEEQLTKSFGDKRTPVYSKDLSGVVFKGPRGKIWKVDEKGQESLLVDLEGCGDFTLAGKEIYFTRLVTGNPQRQQLWKAVGDYPTKEMKLVFRPETGSLRQIQHRGGKFLATHIWRTGEERVVLIDPSKSGKALQAITEAGRICSYPKWVDDRKILVSKRVDDHSYDFFLIDLLSPNTSKRLCDTPKFSEFSATSDQQGNHYYFERTDWQRQWSIARMAIGAGDGKMGEVTPVKLPRAAKEPSMIPSHH